jgi:hypothetical protein
MFVLGLAALFDWLGSVWRERHAAIVSATATAVLILGNFGLMFQWGTHLIPARGPISWRDAAYNQMVVVPKEASQMMLNYLTRRKQLMDRIEEQDVRQLQHR